MFSLPVDLCFQRLLYRVSNERTERGGVSDPLPPPSQSVVMQSTNPSSRGPNQRNLKHPVSPLKISRVARGSLKQLQGKHITVSHQFLSTSFKQAQVWHWKEMDLNLKIICRGKLPLLLLLLVKWQVKVKMLRTLETQITTCYHVL